MPLRSLLRLAGAPRRLGYRSRYRSPFKKQRHRANPVPLFFDYTAKLPAVPISRHAAEEALVPPSPYAAERTTDSLFLFKPGFSTVYRTQMRLFARKLPYRPFFGSNNGTSVRLPPKKRVLLTDKVFCVRYGQRAGLRRLLRRCEQAYGIRCVRSQLRSQAIQAREKRIRTAERPPASSAPRTSPSAVSSSPTFSSSTLTR